MRGIGAVLRAALVTAALAAVGVAAAPPARGATPPPGFFGVVPQAPLSSADLARIGDAGLGLRLPVTWYGVEPQQGVFDFAELDRVIGEAADRGIAVMPQLGGTPPWIASSPASHPLSQRGLAAWRGFLARLVARYGSDGSFWPGRAHRQPVRRWQIWNEPNFNLYWSPPSPRDYAHLLHVSAATIRKLDPKARIVAAAVAPIEHAMRPWAFLEKLYRVPGFRRDFDFAALHPYASTSTGVAYGVRRVRRVMAKAGDGRKPLLVTEVGVASAAQRPNPFDQSVGQARFLQTTFEKLLLERRRWRLAGAYWFTWQDGGADDPTCVFCQYAGLFDAAGQPKPAWWTLQRLLGNGRGGARVR